MIGAHRLRIDSRIVAVVAVVLAASALPLRAQDGQSAHSAEASGVNPVAAPARAEPVAISAGDIPQRATQDEGQLQAIRISLDARDLRVEEIETGLPSEADAIRRAS